MLSASTLHSEMGEHSGSSTPLQDEDALPAEEPTVDDAPHIDVIDPGEMTYDSILATNSSETHRRRVPFLWCSIICHFCCASLVAGLWLWLYVAKRDAPCARPLQLWALVNALSPICLILLSFVNSALKSQSDRSYSAWLVLVSGFSCLVVVFYVVWFVIGNVWTYGMPEGECELTLFHVCFWFITSVYIVLGLSTLFPCLQLAYAFCIVNPKKPPHNALSNSRSSL